MRVKGLFYDSDFSKGTVSYLFGDKSENFDPESVVFKLLVDM